jgi:hypothetical protein
MLGRLLILVVLVSGGGPRGAVAEPARDGTSVERAVILKSDAGSSGGVAGEAAWLREHYPGWRRTRQALMSRNGRRYDRIDVESPTGEKASIYFDVTEAFGLVR